MNLERASSGAMERMLASAGILGPILFVAGFTVAGWLRPGYSAMAEAVSDLGVGYEAWIQNINFFLFGGLLLAFAIGFARLMPRVMGNRSARIGAWLIATAGVGVVASGVFPAAPPTEGLHFLAGFLLAFGSAIASAVYVGRKLRHARLAGIRPILDLDRNRSWSAHRAFVCRPQPEFSLGGGRARRSHRADTGG